MNYKEQMERYLKGLEGKVGEHNANLIQDFNKRHQALPSEPSYKRMIVVLNRLSSISKMIDNKPLDKINEDDLITLNNVMRNKQMKSASDYRKALKLFLRIEVKPKLPKSKRLDLLELLDSAYLKNSSNMKNKEKPVNPEKFWSFEEKKKYIEASKLYGSRQLAWATLWLLTGGNPKEILAIQKKDIFEKNGKLNIKINGTKTAYRDRLIVLTEAETNQAREYLTPRLSEIKDNEKVIDINYSRQNYVHHFLCEQIKLPKNKYWNLYCGRKMRLTQWYNDPRLGNVKASQYAGHVPGSRDMKHYVGLTEAQLQGEEIKGIEKQVCPNPGCNYEGNETTQSVCVKCGSPLDRKVYAGILEKNTQKLIDTQLENFKKEFALKVLTQS